MNTTSTIATGVQPADDRVSAAERSEANPDDVAGHIIGAVIGGGLIVVGVGLVIYGQSIETDSGGPTWGDIYDRWVETGKGGRQPSGRPQ